jgi:predicted dehydrogenase
MTDSSGAGRRQFIRTGSGALAAAALSRRPAAAAQSGASGTRSRLAIVGTGIRGVGMFGVPVVRDYADRVELVALCDINPGRLEYARGYIGTDCATFTDFDAMMRQAEPDRLVVTTVDDTHDRFIVAGLDAGCDVISEKPMTTDERKCQAILDAADRSRGELVVTHNYRYSPHRQRMKEILQSGRIGRLTSVDFHWYLDVYHGADYFRRWHGEERHSGSLFVHKACHHFDLLNWWIESEPEQVFAHAALEYYGHNNEFRHDKCRGCPHRERCRHHWDITADEHLVGLYVENEQHDGYLRDACVWGEQIDVFDKMAAQIRYASGVQVSYSCTTYSPYEGYRIAFNGTRGRLEAWIQERQPWPMADYDELRVTDNFGETELIQVSHGGGGHGGADGRLRDRLFKDRQAPDPWRQAAGVRDGAMAVLIGVAARESVKRQEPVAIASLTTLKPRAVRP